MKNNIEQIKEYRDFDRKSLVESYDVKLAGLSNLDLSMGMHICGVLIQYIKNKSSLDPIQEQQVKLFFLGLLQIYYMFIDCSEQKEQHDIEDKDKQTPKNHALDPS